MSGIRPAELDGPECPLEMRPIFERFVALSQFRRAGMSGPERIAPLDILALAWITDDWPAPWEVRVLARLDLAFLQIVADARPRRGGATGGGQRPEAKGDSLARREKPRATKH